MNKSPSDEQDMPVSLYFFFKRKITLFLLISDWNSTKHWRLCWIPSNFQSQSLLNKPLPKHGILDKKMDFHLYFLDVMECLGKKIKINKNHRCVLLSCRRMHYTFWHLMHKFDRYSIANQSVVCQYFTREWGLMEWNF